MTVVGWRSRRAIGKRLLRAGHLWIQGSQRLAVILSKRALQPGNDAELEPLDRFAEFSG